MPSVRTYNLDILDIAGIRALLWEALSLKWARDGHYPVKVVLRGLSLNLLTYC